MDERVTLYTDADYDLLSTWWRGHGSEPVPRGVLGLGVLGWINDCPCAAGFGMLDKFAPAPLGIIEFLVTDPVNSPRESYRGCQLVVRCLRNLLTKRGAVIVMSFFSNPGLNRIMTRERFILNEKNIESHLYLKEAE